MTDLYDQDKDPETVKPSRGLNELRDAIHKTATEHGWWDPQEQAVELVDADGNAYLDNVKVQRSFGDMIALVHSEVSESLEAFRDWGMVEKYTNGHDAVSDSPIEGWKPDGVFTELGDAIIRILDMAGHYGVDIQSLVEQKMAYNETRPYRHGGKKL